MTIGLNEIPSNPNALGQATAAGAGVTLGPVELHPPGRLEAEGSRGRTVQVVFSGTPYASAYLEGSLDPSDSSSWSVCWDQITQSVCDLTGATVAIIVLAADYQQMRITTTGGDGTSAVKLSVGP